MNDPNKVIDVNLSSLLSLKAELLRKQSEVNEAKASRSNISEYEANKAALNSESREETKTKSKSNTKEKDSKHDKKVKGGTTEELEDSSLLEKSRKVLEAKSRFYDKLARTRGQSISSESCLVDFSGKYNEFQRHDTYDKRVISDESDVSSDNEPYDDGNEEDWVEYIDCLGRTRKCLKQDLESAKKRDAELAASMPERIDQSKANWMIDKPEIDDDNEPIGPMPPESFCTDLNSMLSKHDEQRANWERTEQENLDKTDVHYQDVFFDEARQHGVGYYAFSTDAEIRKKQQKELDEARERTMEEQQRRDTLRAQRERIIAERVLAAKNRQRARLGLPPLEKEETKEEKKETKEERKARKKEEKLKKKKEELEKQKEAEREKYVRPWDLDKNGRVVPSRVERSDDEEEKEWSYKPERTVLSQEEWNELKRTERVSEFAPPSEKHTSNPKRTNFSHNSSEHSDSQNSDYRQMPPPSDNGFSSFQSSKREFQRRSYQQSNDSDGRKGACVPPPENLDCSLPFKKPRTSNDLERSIEAGLRFLRDSCDKGTFSTKSSWTAKADY